MHGRELARENARLYRTVWDLQKRIQDIEMRHDTTAAEASRIIQDDKERLEKAKSAKRRAGERRKSEEEKRKKATGELRETKEGMERTKRRNSSWPPRPAI